MDTPVVPHIKKVCYYDNTMRVKGGETVDDRDAHRGWTEDLPVQLPLAMNVVLGDLHLKTSRLPIKQLHAINRPYYLDVTSWRFRV